MQKLAPWIVVLALGCAGARAAEEKAPVPSGDKELALRYISLAQDTLRAAKSPQPQHFRQSATLIEAAMSLDPTEPRYARMLYEAMLQVRDSEGALRALSKYRAIDVPGLSEEQQPRNDQLAMVQMIDLQANLLQTAGQRFDHYNKFLDEKFSNLPGAVRSHIAYRASVLAAERGQNDLADSLVEKSLTLNPLNMDALGAKLAQLDQNGTTEQRMAVMLQMLKSNPVQPDVTNRLAREMADAGLPDESLRFYALTVNLATATGRQMGREFALLYANELYLTGQPQFLTVTKTITEQLLKADPNDVEALLTRWFAERAGNEAEAAVKTQKALLNAAFNRVLVARQQLGNTGAAATTRPVESNDPIVLPDLTDDLKKLEDEKFAQVRDFYEQALGDLAWYLVLVDGKPDQTLKLIPALKTLLGEGDPLVVRLEGWCGLASGQAEVASQKLGAAADRDVLARAGLLLVQSKKQGEKEKAVEGANQLLAANPSNLLATILSDVLKPLGVKLTPRADAAALQKQIQDFPKAWLGIITAPNTFYTIKASMDKGQILFPFGDPIIAVVWIKNTSTFDLTIGADGVIKSDLWFDAQMRGLVQQTVSGAAYDRLSQKMVLKPGETLEQRVRLDQGQLYQVLMGNPTPTLAFYGQVRTNPRADGSSAPCGYGVQFSAITERAGFRLDEASLQSLRGLIAGGTPAEKIRSLELLGSLVEWLKTPQQAANPQAAQAAATLLDTLEKSIADPSPGVSTWGGFLTAVHKADKRRPIMEKMLEDPDPKRRVLGLMIGNALERKEQRQLLEKFIAAEKDESVRAYAKGMLDLWEAATTQPTAGAGGAGGEVAPKNP